MRLIKDLGMRPIGNKGASAHFGLYECPVCLKHFEVNTGSVTSGASTKCRKCADRAHADSMIARVRADLIARFIIVHGDTYDYSKVDYKNSRTKVEIICKKHGSFWQNHNEHLRGSGCPHCAKERGNIALRMSEKNDKPTMLYYIHFTEVNLWKIGCTTKTIEERFRQDNLQYIVLQTKEYTSGYEAYRVEKFILDTTKADQFNGIALKGGNSELRSIEIPNILELIHEAEKAFSQL